MWKDLTMQQRADVISMAVKAGMRDMASIRSFYDESVGSRSEYNKGGYLTWKDKVSKYKHLNIDNDNTYDYEGFYNENPRRAWDLLKEDSDAHFTDRYKTVYHPTFSTESKYSGVVNDRFNPQGLNGGTWSRDNHVFLMSPDGYRGPISMDERKAYLEDAEDNGVQLREADGSLPIYDGDIWGGVLPAVTIRGNKYPDGGKTYIGGSDRELVITPEQTFIQSIANKDPYVDYQFYSPTGNSVVQTINSTPRWQQYWADQEGARVAEAKKKAAPYILNLLTAIDAVATGPEMLKGLYGLYNLAKSGVRNGVRRIATAAKTAPKITAENAANTGIKRNLSIKNKFEIDTKGLIETIQDEIKRNQWKALTKGEEDVFNYLGSDKHISRIMKSGVSKEEATKIATDMKLNAMATDRAIDYTGSGEKYMNIGEYDNGFFSNHRATFNPKYIVKKGLGEEDTYSTVIHELGGHGATMGYRPGSYSDINDMAATWYEDAMTEWSPYHKEVYKHNSSLRPIRNPEYANVKDSHIEYLEGVDEYSARARAANIDPSGNNRRDFSELYKYFTKESVDKLKEGVWSLTPLGLGLGASTLPNKSRRKVK